MTPTSPLDVAWLTVEEIAASLRVSRMTVYRLVSTGALPAVKVGRSLRVDRADLARYLTQVEL